MKQTAWRENVREGGRGERCRVDGEIEGEMECQRNTERGERQRDGGSVRRDGGAETGEDMAEKTQADKEGGGGGGGGGRGERGCT